MPGAGEKAVRAAADISVCPGRASAMMRAAVDLATPSASIGLAPRATSCGGFSRRLNGPRWIAARDCSGGSDAASVGVVRGGVAERIGDGLEQQQEAIALVDLAAAPGLQQVACDAVVRSPQRGSVPVAEAQRRRRAVDDVGHHEDASDLER
jgi:hypothetical protein